MSAKIRTNPVLTQLLVDVETYLSKYVTFTDPTTVFACALWTCATYIWPDFDVFPYLHITADTKRAGKTRLSEVVSFAASNSRNVAGATPATVFRWIRDEQPTLFIDEAETLSSESATMMRAVLNVGYRKGQMIPRMGKAGVEEWPAYCPKVFILIGDPYDTLRDRCIRVYLKRSNDAARMVYSIAKDEGGILGGRIASEMADLKSQIIEWYQAAEMPEFLNDRDAELWLPLFAICQAFDPSRYEDLQRVAVDLSTEKTQAARRHVELGSSEAEAEADEYARRLVLDLLTVLGTKDVVYSNDALELLKALPTGPWRKYQGVGLTTITMSDLLSRFNLSPKLIRTGGKSASAKVARGYRRVDLDMIKKAHSF